MFLWKRQYISVNNTTATISAVVEVKLGKHCMECTLPTAIDLGEFDEGMCILTPFSYRNRKMDLISGRKISLGEKAPPKFIEGLS